MTIMASQITVIPKNLHQDSRDGLRFEVLLEFYANIESPRTLEAYKLDIDQFFNFIKSNFNNFHEIKDLSSLHVVTYKKYLESLGVAPKTVLRKLSSLGAFLKFLFGKGLISHNPLMGVKRGKNIVETPTEALEDFEAEALIKELTKSDLICNKSLGVLLLLSTGIRREEVINIRVGDISIINKTPVIRVIGKGRKEVIKPIPAWVFDLISRHIKREDLDKEDFLLVQNKKTLTKSTLYRFLKRKISELGIDKNISPHSIRATYITISIESGVRLDVLQDDVGHADIKTTMGYNKSRKRIEDSPIHSINFLKKSS